jgi:L-ascorbate metabolism protein UlaG (beta-lactamase superfamily)
MMGSLSRLKVVLALQILGVMAFAYPQDGQEQREKEQASIWYLGHSGFGIKTQGHFLIFDYAPQTRWKSKLSKGGIDPKEIKQYKVLVFVSHAHRDHFDPRIFRWASSMDTVTYILSRGCRAKKIKDAKIVRIGPNRSKRVGDAEIITIKSTDEGVGFLVKVDGLSVFHAGDHALWDEALSRAYKRQIDRLAKRHGAVDIAFIPVGRSKSVRKGAYYAIKRLSPRAIFPMHCRGNEREYRSFAKAAKKKGIKGEIFCAKKRGDKFVYKGKVE